VPACLQQITAQHGTLAVFGNLALSLLVVVVAVQLVRRGSARRRARLGRPITVSVRRSRRPAALRRRLSGHSVHFCLLALRFACWRLLAVSRTTSVIGALVVAWRRGS